MRVKMGPSHRDGMTVSAQDRRETKLATESKQPQKRQIKHKQHKRSYRPYGTNCFFYVVPGSSCLATIISPRPQRFA
jgi:hypothetical protein